jgi:hypothetical protein
LPIKSHTLWEKFQKHSEIVVEFEKRINDQLETYCEGYDCAYIEVVTTGNIEKMDEAIKLALQQDALEYRKKHLCNLAKTLHGKIKSSSSL